VGEVLASVLLLTSFEIWVVFADKRLEDCRADTVLVKLLLTIFNFFALHDNFCRNFLLRIFPRLQSNCKFEDLALGARWCELVTRIQVSFSIAEIVFSDFRKVEKDLHDRIHVA